jgi:diaminohydroxyphosphoribosylaminopyrimidine deaminase/5-amino-6-(5-phosphoribosylamino)uracil reductase
VALLYALQNRLTPELAVFNIESEIIIFTTKVDKSTQWPHFVRHIEVPQQNNKVNLTSVLAHLAKLQFNHVYLEAGATLAGKMTELNLIDEYIFYLAPKLMGGDAKSLVNFAPLTDMQNTVNLTFKECVKIGDDLRITATKHIPIT